tara:strand:+ start:221 stop:403 length:183 start_codon:yes stop_codon:yes gene_type:complete
MNKHTPKRYYATLINYHTGEIVLKSPRPFNTYTAAAKKSSLMLAHHGVIGNQTHVIEEKS